MSFEGDKLSFKHYKIPFKTTYYSS